MTNTPPAAPACLTRPYSAKPHQKGGTLIAESVDSLEEHRRLVADPDAYRPPHCPQCDSSHLHAHDFRTRILNTGSQVFVEVIRRYRCVEAGCGAIWRILPAVIARHLHRTWDTVQAATSERSTRVPPATRRRWLARLRMVATQLTQLLATAAHPRALVVTDGLPINCSRGVLVDALAEGGVLSRQRRLQQIAAWVHRLAPGVRLM